MRWLSVHSRAVIATLLTEQEEDVDDIQEQGKDSILLLIANSDIRAWEY